MISASCPKCERSYTVDSRFAGKKVRCKGCDSTFIIGVEPNDTIEYFESIEDELDDVPSNKAVWDSPPARPPRRQKRKKTIDFDSEEQRVSNSRPYYAIIAGAAGGIAGVLIWGAVACFFHREVGYVAWGIGLLVGYLVKRTAKGLNDGTAGAIAAVLSALSILLGKLLAAVFIANWLIKDGKIPPDLGPEMYWSVVGFTFQLSFGLMDSVFFILAIGTAYRLGSSSEEK